jgi:hypothetical protein
VPPNKNLYPRPKLDVSARKKFVADLIDQLRDLEQKTDPKDGAVSAKGKNRMAFRAIEIASKITKALAGWALDHQAGLALKDLKPVHVRAEMRAESIEHPDSSNNRFTDDDHRHEWYGRNWIGRVRGADVDPVVARKWLMNLVRANTGIFELTLMLRTLAALEACDYGEILPMLAATKENRKINWTILQLQLRAIAAVKYREARGAKKFIALEEVAEAFGVSPNTVRRGNGD